jgi:hypothetical protein
LFLSAHPPNRLSAQAPLTIAGRMLRVRDADTSALAGTWVVAHEVGETRQGPLDSIRSDAQGRFRFVVARPESSAVYVVSARHQGIGYFSDPVQPGPEAPPLTLIVFDTSVTGPALTVTIRQVVITKGAAGQNRVLDIFQVLNPGRATRVGRDSSVSVWGTKLPADVVSPQPGEADVPASAIRFEDGRVDVLAPFPPGLKQVVITYDMAAGGRTLTIPIEHLTERLEVLVEDSTATVTGSLAAEDPVAIEGRNFRRYVADSVAIGAAPTVRFTVSRLDARRFTWIAVAAAAIALAAGAALALRRRPPADAAAAAVAAPARGPLDAESPERLAAQIAALDEKFAGREAETDPAQWATYQARRAELKDALTRRVARA